MYGLDQDLLKTRAMVLNSAGYLIWAATTMSAFEQLLCAEPVGLCILCHTLMGEDCQRAISLIERFRPEIHVLSLKGTVSFPRSSMSVRIFGDFVNPLALIQVVSELLQNPPNLA
jgi:hypothetical protein